MTPDQLHTWLRSSPRRTLVMGVLNVTPDSFSDGGQFIDPQSAAAHALEMAANGADVIDIGGESTRPRSTPVDAAEQIRRVIPVIAAMRRQSPVAISVDTTQSAVAAAALDAGANLINDISAARDDINMLPLAAKTHAPIVLMHMQGAPATMQINPHYQDVVAEVKAFLAERRDAAISAGVSPADILLDPGIGFGKTVDHNLQLLRALPELAALGSPILLGTSRKSFLVKLWTGGGSEKSSPPVASEIAELARSFGTAATTAWAVAAGASIVRVHDPAVAIGVIRIIEAICHQRPM